MAMDHRQSIEQVKADAIRLTQKRIQEADDEAQRQAEADNAENQEATNKTKPAGK